MDKVCIFCGNKPDNKNKEHVIPKWLIDMTGNKSRMATWGLRYEDLIFNESTEDKVDSMQFSFLNFTFPACEKCNSFYGMGLESKAKEVMTKLLVGSEVNSQEMNQLLDWFDKVRIGLWLSYLYLNRSDNINPKFYINDRVGKTDRALYVFRTDSTVKELHVVGPSGMLFSRMPIAMGLQVNDLFFINVSEDFLVSKELGFPVPNSIEYDDNGNIGIDKFTPGDENADFSNLMKKITIVKPEMAFFQPIYTKYMTDFKDVYQSEYVMNNSFYYDKGLGDIFYYLNDVTGKLTDEPLPISYKGSYIREYFLPRWARIVFKYLIGRAEDMKDKYSDVEIRKEIDVAIRYQQFLLSKVK